MTTIGLGVLRKLVYSGTAYEIGREMGRSLEGLPVPKAAKEEVVFAHACRDTTGRIFPSALDTFRGIVDGSGLGGDDFLTYYFARREGVLRGCTMFAARHPATRDGVTLVGRNYDWVNSDQKWCELRMIRQEGAFPVLGYSHHWAGLPDALNAEGLFVAIASLPKRPPELPGLQWNLVVDVLMATCRTVPEAEKLITSFHHLRAMTYLIADASGEAIAAEARPEGVTIRRSSDGLVLATNHEVTEVEASDRDKRSRRRYERAEAVLRAHAGWVDEGVAEEVLADHRGQICSGPHHDHVGRDSWGTLWSTICRPDLRTLKIAQGHPCEVDYEPVSFRTQAEFVQVSESCRN